MLHVQCADLQVFGDSVLIWPLPWFYDGAQHGFVFPRRPAHPSSSV